jgi:glutaredoxin-like YruB-family protein
MLEWIRDVTHLNQVRKDHNDYLLLAFWGKFSSAARRALREWEKFAAENKDVPLFVLDVEKVKGVHKSFGVAEVPTVVVLERGKPTRSVVGTQSAQFYSIYMAGGAPRRAGGDARTKPLRVTVYTSPGCPACTTLKTYLRRRGVPFREIDVSKDQRAAEALVRRSGQMAVPQTDINGRLVVGFDRARLDPLLGVPKEG